MPGRFPLKTALIVFLENGVKPILIVALCVVGLVFEFLLELPFIFIIGFHRVWGARRR